ncbi:MAG: hypothetical protein WBA12_12045 [Catalinimonas sp.]
MRQLQHLLRWDGIHLWRNQIVQVSLLVGAVYLGAFYLLRSLGALDDLLVVLVFNDPIVMSYFFAGVLLLFERDQRTLEALAVTPLDTATYLLSRGLTLATLATAVALAMVWTGGGFRLHYVPFLLGTFGTSALFAWWGCLVGRASAGFNVFLLRSVLFVLPVALPLLWLFGAWNHPLLWGIPSMPGVVLLKGAFAPLPTWQYAYGYGYLGGALLLTFWWSKRFFRPQ